MRSISSLKHIINNKSKPLFSYLPFHNISKRFIIYFVSRPVFSGYSVLFSCGCAPASLKNRSARGYGLFSGMVFVFGPDLFSAANNGRCALHMGCQEPSAKLHPYDSLQSRLGNRGLSNVAEVNMRSHVHTPMFALPLNQLNFLAGSNQNALLLMCRPNEGFSLWIIASHEGFFCYTAAFLTTVKLLRRPSLAL